MKNHIDYNQKTLKEIIQLLNQRPKEVVLNGNNLSINEIIAVAFHNTKVSLTKDKKILGRISKSYEKMIQDVEDGVPIYGCNSGYGQQASRVLTQGSKSQRKKIAKQISEGISHIDVSTGPIFEKAIVRAAIVIRVNMLVRGVSAVRIEDLNVLISMLNNHVTPIVNQYGGIGASGDLAHNARILSAARGLTGTKAWNKEGKIVDAKTALKQANIKPLELQPKAGLGLVNGDNFSTAVATIIAYKTFNIQNISLITSAMTVEVLQASSRTFHPLLAEVRKHPGQEEAARIIRNLIKNSKLSFNEMDGHKPRPKNVKIQDSYSLRALAQFHAVNIEKVKNSFNTITINANAASDNPLWVPPEYTTEGEQAWGWVSGGNFLAMHMVEVLDGLRKTMTQITKLSDRHIARIVNPQENNGLPPNLSDDSAITGCAFKGVQIQSGMYEVYAQLLSFPVSTLFGVHEEGNQDITAHSLTSGILALENLRIATYAQAQHLAAIAQAVDLRGGPKLLSPNTRGIYKIVRKISSYVRKERPLGDDIQKLYEMIDNNKLEDILDKTIN